MTVSKAGAAALALLAASTVAATPALAADEKQPSVFLQCDGRVGHVSGGERALRLLLVTATAGLSETAMASDDDSRRAKGAAGVAACDAALAKETDLYRRAQLGLARAMHFAEDQKWQQAAEAAHQVPGLVGNTGDWALTRTTAAAAANIEAWALVEDGKLGDAEAVQARAVLAAGPDALALQRTGPYMRLTRTMSEEKRQAYWHLLRFAPEYQSLVINGFADAGQYDDARAALHTTDAVQKAMYKKGNSNAEIESLDAGFAAMAGKAAEASTVLEKARAAFAKERAEGTIRPDLIGETEEQIAFAEAAIAHAEGRDSEARRLIGQREIWAHVAPGMVADLVTTLASGASDSEKAGALKDDPLTAWSDSISQKVAALKEDAVRKRNWRSLSELMVDAHYRPMAGQALSGATDKPKWLLKPDKEDPARFEILSVDGRFFGAAVNEPLYLQAALIARARGKKGFVLFPVRKELSTIGVKFVNPGEEGIGEPSIIDADPLIAELQPHIVPPAS